MSYQAVIRDADKKLVITQVGMRISIRQGTADGTAVYTEIQTPIPNINGLVTIEIGTGTTTDDFSAINWANGPYFIKTETDPDNTDGLTDYTIVGTSQILSVPYALYAKKAEGISGTITASQVSDFQSSVTNNAAVLLNTDKVTNANHTGDATGSGALTLATVNSDVGTFNNITINAKGLATAGSNVSYVTSEADPIVKAINGIIKSNGTNISAAVAGTDYLTPTGSAASLTDFPILNQPTTGSAASFTGSLAGDVTGTQGATVVGNDAVTGKILTGYVSGAGTVAATDNILQAIQKLDGNDATNANLTGMVTSVGNETTVVTNADLTGDVISTGNTTVIANKQTMTATAPVSITGSPTVIASGAVAISIAAATPGTAGSMSGTDKTKLDGLHNADGSETLVTSGTNILVTGSGTTGSPYIVNSSINSWTLTGNSGTVDGTNFIGTTDNIPLVFKVNGQKAGKIDHLLFNTFLGYQSGNLNSTGGPNTAIGYQSLYYNTVAYQNTANGYQALYGNTGYSNTAIGHRALYSNGSSNDNTAIGNKALYNSYNGQNTATGAQSLYQNTSGSSNAAFGYNSLFANNSGTNNTAVGVGALGSNTTGNNNTAIGNNAFATGTSLSNSTAIGYNAQVTASNSLVLGGTGVDAVKVGIGVTAPAATLDILGNIKIKDGTQGTGKVLISDANGLASWNTPATGWGLTGNSGTVDGTNYIGTNDNIPLSFRVNNQKAGRIDQNGPTFLGYQAGNSNTSNQNTGIGYHALYINTSGFANTATGLNALSGNINGNNNTANGLQSLSNNSSGSSNTGFGYQTLLSNTTGSGNTALGYNANVGSGGLTNATAIGYNSMVSASNSLVLGGTGADAVKVGIGVTVPAATLDIAGNVKIADGTQGAGKVLTSDANGVGSWAAAGNGGWGLTGNSGTVDGTNFIGTTDNIPFNIRVNNQNAGRIDPTLFNTFYGYQSGGNSITSGSSNNAFGLAALTSDTEGSGNNAFGESALYYNTTGVANIANGYQALYYNTIGGFNIATGYRALYLNTAASDNIAIGLFAMSNQSYDPGSDWSSNNVAVGREALYNNQPTSTSNGISNTAVGNYAIRNNSTGSQNTANGLKALYSNTTGSKNTALGYQAGYTSTPANANTTGSNNTYIGYNSGPGTSSQLTNATAIGYNALVAASNSLVLGGTGADAVKVGIGVTSPAATLDVAGNVKIVDGTQGAGKVLTSDADGTAIWAAPAGGSGTHTIGETYGGGIIFWLDSSGQHGLIAATADQSNGIQWYNGSYTTTGAILDGVYAGKANTNLIISNQGAGTYAAQVCNDYAVTVNNEYYDDWYLPSKYELNLLYLLIGGTVGGDYWSSTENDSSHAWKQSFNFGDQHSVGKNQQNKVRAIRSF